MEPLRESGHEAWEDRRELLDGRRDEWLVLVGVSGGTTTPLDRSSSEVAK